LAAGGVWVGSGLKRSAGFRPERLSGELLAHRSQGFLADFGLRSAATTNNNSRMLHSQLAHTVIAFVAVFVLAIYLLLRFVSR
jgi:hypothetical protein